MVPAKEVGGDFYDYYPIDDDHWAFVIADVSGKGIPAALFMMVTSSLVHHVAVSSAETDPAKVLRKVNAEICLRNPEEMFITVWLGILELSTGKLTAASAGHEYPVLKKAGENFELFKDRHGLVIGAMEGAHYSRATYNYVRVVHNQMGNISSGNEGGFGGDPINGGNL